MIYLIEKVKPDQGHQTSIKRSIALA